MNDINEIKEALSKATGSFFQDFAEYYPNDPNALIIQHSLGWLYSLITTIESQKEEIEGLHDALEMLPPKDVEIHERTQIKIKETVQELVIASLRDQVESLEAITELAVKGLKEIVAYKKGEALVYVQEIKNIANSSLAEIERLGQEASK